MSAPETPRDDVSTYIASLPPAAREARELALRAYRAELAEQRERERRETVAALRAAEAERAAIIASRRAAAVPAPRFPAAPAPARGPVHATPVHAHNVASSWGAVMARGESRRTVQAISRDGCRIGTYREPSPPTLADPAPVPRAVRRAEKVSRCYAVAMALGHGRERIVGRWPSRALAREAMRAMLRAYDVDRAPALRVVRVRVAD